MTENENVVNQALAKEPLVITLNPSKKKKVFSDIESYRKFIELENEHWNALLNHPGRPRSSIEALLSNAQSDLKNIDRALSIKPENALSLLRSSSQHLQELPLFSDTVEGRFAGELQKTNVERTLGAISFLVPKFQGAGIVNSSPEALRGFLEAYSRFGEGPDRRAKKVLDDLEHQRKSLEDGLGDLQERFLRLSTELSQKSETHGRELNVQSAELKGTRDQWTNDIETLYTKTTTRVAELENLYGEKLRLQGPAEYWKRLATRYRNSGVLWSIISGALVVAGSWAGIAGLDFFQKAIAAGQSVIPGSTAATTDWSHILPVTIVFGVIISVWVFVVRTTIRLALSGFHLVRDAVEREQLSHYYLALIAGDKTLDKDAQTIILQSLFSRAETGLLKGESGPTMPGNLTEILKNLRG